MPRSVILKLTLLIIFLLLAGCSSESKKAVGPVKFSDPNAMEPTAGEWRTWVVADITTLRPDAPGEPSGAELQTVRDAVTSRDIADITSIDFWNEGTARQWNNRHRQLIAANSVNPPRASRQLALVSVAMYDAMVAAWDAKYTYLRRRPNKFDTTLAVYGNVPNSPSFVSERAAMSAAAAVVLTSFYDTAAASIDLLLQNAMSADLTSGIHFPSDIEAGEAIGAAVGAQVLARAQTDNSNAVYTGTPLTGPGFWQPTPPAFAVNPLEPACGQWDTWIIDSGSALRPPAPPAYGSPEFNAQLAEVWQANQQLTSERLAIAQFWADGPGTQTPPGHWNEIALDFAQQRDLNEPRTARMLALLGMAQADAFIACWDCKFEFWCVRPITEIRSTYDANWLSPVTTPPFPAYPSGHSTTSGAAATVLGYIFPQDAVEISMMATEAMNSRLFGGIHFPFDNFNGFSLGTAIGTQVVAQGLTDGSPHTIPADGVIIATD